MNRELRGVAFGFQLPNYQITHSPILPPLPLPGSPTAFQLIPERRVFERHLLVQSLAAAAFVQRQVALR
jgi:hypothetical protein